VSLKIFNLITAIHSKFEGCADIFICDRTPEKVTIELIIPYTNVDIFREKGAKSFHKKGWEPLNYMKNGSKKKS
jgi:hypothetical protein